ncbi:MAG: FecR domain-containing protein [Anaerolineae bacterium]|nr:FecR domain-containing protein [Anaerolineae bacterium]
MIITSAFPIVSVLAQPDGLAATLEVLAEGVEVRRVDTSNWIAVAVESIVGAGDTIRTDDTGRARITFFADGTDVELRPNTEVRVMGFRGTEDTFSLELEVFVGETLQRIGRALGADSRYEIHTPVMTLAARGTVFAIRTEDGDRTGMLVFEGAVEASQAEETKTVPEAFGIRADEDTGLSDVVRASTFEELNAALDGCTVSVSSEDDISFNVRLQPSGDAPRVGTLMPGEIVRVFGVSESGGWYRVAFRDWFGWIRSSTLVVNDACAGLRVFADDAGPEDATRYSSLGDAITLDGLLITPTPAPTPTPASSG